MKDTIYKFILLIWGVLISAGMFAQDAILKGTVLDNQNKPLENVSVVIGEVAGALTGESGGYNLSVPPGEYTVSFSYLGFETKNIKLKLEAGKDNLLDINLVNTGMTLETTVITGNPFEKKVSDEVVSIEVINKNYLRNAGIRDIGDALERVPGVQIQDGQISIRGGNAYSYGVGSRVLVLSDGLSIMTNDLGEANSKILPIEIAEQVEVIKGASSVQYGSSALNGVINFRTRWPVDEKPKTQMSFIAGVYERPAMKEKQWWNLDSVGVLGINLWANTFSRPTTHTNPTHLPGTLTSMFSHEFKKDNNQWVFGLYTDRVQSYIEKADEARKRIDIKYRKLDPKINGLQYGVISHFMKEEFQRFFFSRDLDTNAYRFSQGSDDSYVNGVISPFIEYVDDNSSYRLDVRYITRFREGGGTDRDAWDNSLQIRPQVTKMHKKFIFTFGLPATLGASVSNLYPKWRKNYMIAGFGQAEYKTNRLSVIVGGRAEALSVDTIVNYTRPIMRAGINYQIGRGTHLKGNIGQAYRMPTIAERFLITDFAGGLAIIPTPSLQSETGWTSEIGVLQGFSKEKFKGGFEGTFFWNQFKNYVEYQFGIYDNKGENGEVLFPGKPEKIFGLKPINLANTRITGIEIKMFGTGNVSKNIQLSGNLGYTYSYPGNLANDSLRNTPADSMRNISTYFHYFAADWGRHLGGDPNQGYLRVQPFRSRHLFRGDIETQYKGWNLGLNANYTSYPEYVPDLFVLAIAFLTSDLEGFEKYSAKHIGGDLLLNGRIGYEWNEKKYRLGFVVNNLTNWEYSTRPGKMESPRYYQLQFRYML